MNSYTDDIDPMYTDSDATMIAESDDEITDEIQSDDQAWSDSESECEKDYL